MGSDWRKFKTISCGDICKVFEEEVVDDVLCEIAKRQQNNNADSFLLINADALVRNISPLKLLFKNRTIFLDTRRVEIRELSEWFEQNRKPERKFHLSPKHGENGKGAHTTNKGDKVSLLLCSKEKAAILLNKAVGEDLACKTLFFKDTDNDKYIEFKSEGGNIYHAFHLDEEDSEHRISTEVRQKIAKLL